MNAFVQRLKERKLAQWALAYVTAAFAFIQVADLVAQRFGWSEAIVRGLIVACAIGFFVTLVLAWYHGDRGAQRVSGAELLILALLLAIGGGLLWRLQGAREAASPGDASSTPKAPSTANPANAAEKSVAVLPLFGVGGEAKDDYLGDGISEEVLNALSKIPGLAVIGRASSFQFRGNNVDAAAVGRALNVRSLLSGTVQRAGDDLRIRVELIDTASGRQLWSERYDRTFKNLFALEDDIAGAVGRALAVKLGGDAKKSLVDVATHNPHAHDLYLQGRQLAYLSDEASLNRAVTLLNQAIAEDPAYAEAWAGLVYVYMFLADAYRAPVDLLPTASGAAEKAVALDPNLASAHAYRGYILMAYARDFPAARRELEQAVALNPGSADAHWLYGLYLLQAERNAAPGRAELRVAEKLDPLNSWLWYTEMWAATAQADFAGAVELAQHVLGIDPKFFYLSDPLAFAYAAAGRWQECIDRAAAARASAGDQPDFGEAICHAHLGNAARGRAILQRIEADARDHYVDSSNIAAVRAALGDKDGALAALEQAERDRSQPLLNAWFLPWFEPLHDDPRYRALIDRIYAGAPARAEAKRQ